MMEIVMFKQTYAQFISPINRIDKQDRLEMMWQTTVLMLFVSINTWQENMHSHLC